MRRVLFLLLGSALAAGCVAPSRELKLALNDHLTRGDYEGAAQAIEAVRGSQYGEAQAVLYYLDKAAVLHSARRYQESDQLLDQAELKMEDLYTKSVSRTAGSFIVNDNAKEYAGDPHERALLHVMRALNHVFGANHEGALVEARKVTLFLQELNEKYGVKGVYRDDAFAQYLASLLFEDDGRIDDARICRERAREAYGWYASEYGMPTPPLDFAPRSPTDGELVVVHYNGPAPRKESRQIQFAWNRAAALVKENGEGKDAQVSNALTAALSDSVTIAYPVFVSDPQAVVAARVTVAGVSDWTHLAEDVKAIARVSLEQKMSAIQAKSAARAMVKFVAGKVAEEAARRIGGSTIGFLTGLVAKGAAAATEVADTRWWSTVPGEFRIARMSVPAGVHAVDVAYVDAAGNVVSTETLRGVEIVSGARTYVHVRSVL
jgi:hypothetical protein